MEPQPLADERGRLVSGEVRARLWPHPELQLKRDPKLASAKSGQLAAQGGGLLAYMQGLGRENVQSLTSSMSVALE